MYSKFQSYRESCSFQARSWPDPYQFTLRGTSRGVHCATLTTAVYKKNVSKGLTGLKRTLYGSKGLTKNRRTYCSSVFFRAKMSPTKFSGCTSKRAHWAHQKLSQNFWGWGSKGESKGLTLIKIASISVQKKKINCSLKFKAYSKFYHLI